MALTPVVFFELSLPGIRYRCSDPFFIAVKLTKGFVERLQAAQRVCKKHKLKTVVFDAFKHPVELIGSSLVAARIEVRVWPDFVEFSVSGRPWDENGEPGTLRQVAETLAVGLADLFRIKEAGTAVTLHADEDLEIEGGPFGECVYSVLRAESALTRYLQLEWFDPEWARMMEEGDAPGPSREELRRRRMSQAPPKRRKR